MSAAVYALTGYVIGFIGVVGLRVLLDRWEYRKSRIRWDAKNRRVAAEFAAERLAELKRHQNAEQHIMTKMLRKTHG